MAVGGLGHHTNPYVGILSFSVLLFLVSFFSFEVCIHRGRGRLMEKLRTDVGVGV